MKIKEKETEKCDSSNCHCHRGGAQEAIYGLGMIGALFYFLKGVTGFGAIILGIGKAVFWPALVVFKILGMLGI